VAADTVPVSGLLFLSAHPAGESLCRLRTRRAVPFRVGLSLPLPHRADTGCPLSDCRYPVGGGVPQLLASRSSASAPNPLSAVLDFFSLTVFLAG